MNKMLTAALATLLLAGCASAPQDYQPGDALRMHRERFGPFSNVDSQRQHRGCTLPPLSSYPSRPTTLTACQHRAPH